MLAHEEIDPRLLELLVDVQEEAVLVAADAPELTPMQESEREDELTDWLEEHGVGGAWSSPVSSRAGRAPSSTGSPRGLARGLEGAVRWLSYTLETELLMNEIEDSTTRISALVGAAKQYSQMDRAPFQILDVHELLDSTLVMLSRKIGDGVRIVKDYDRSLPEIPVYGAELNQVWTNLIDNALQA
jgi:signal transduction histidine kinase